MVEGVVLGRLRGGWGEGGGDGMEVVVSRCRRCKQLLRNLTVSTWKADHAEAIMPVTQF
jgi:hypothetical protein